MMKHFLKELLKLKITFLNDKDIELYEKLINIKVEDLDEILSNKSPLSLELSYIIEEFIWAKNLIEIAEINELISLTQEFSKEQKNYFIKTNDIISLEAKIGGIIIENAPNYILTKEYDIESRLYLTGNLLFANLEKYSTSALEYINKDEEEEEEYELDDEYYDEEDNGFINREALAQIHESLDKNIEEEYKEHLDKLPIAIQESIRLGNMNEIIKLVLNNYKLKRYTISGLSPYCNGLYVNAKIIMESEEFTNVGDFLSKENFIYMCNSHAELQQKQKILAKERINFFTKSKKD